MPTLIRPFAGLRPVAGRAADVAAPPYDVLNSAEARERAQGKPYSFLHISKPEIDLPPDINPYDAAVYANAAENLAKLRAEGVLVQDDQPCYYVYQLQMGAHVQTGLVAAAWPVISTPPMAGPCGLLMPGGPPRPRPRLTTIGWQAENRCR